ncbi:MAG: hypothetical protein A2V86_00960 [Deltaproteobacteria bacterium RBG_16_49_23]|nr:MAG: hypothetical protein A2V86_00960 [Deltaproteobacteria bacterium RBG_16_49_23]
MTRRQFIKGAAAVTALPLLSHPLPFYGTLAHASGEADLVIAKNGSPSKLLQAAMTPLGGMERFVKKGQRVVIKANIAWARTPEQACTNNPELLSALIKMCYEAGAKRVAVWDHTCDNYQFAFARSGLKEVGQKAGADVLSGHGRNVYKQVEIPKGKKLKSAEVLRDILESDVFINFPIPKHHFATELTLGMKNFIGIVWDMERLHKIDLHQCIADINTLRKPNLVVMDAIRILTTNGPKGPGKTEDIGEVITSTDIVAADAYAAAFFKHPKTGKPFKPEEIKFVKLASDLGLGEIDLAKVRVKKVSAT